MEIAVFIGSALGAMLLSLLIEGLRKVTGIKGKSTLVLVAVLAGITASLYNSFAPIGWKDMFAELWGTMSFFSVATYEFLLKQEK